MAQMDAGQYLLKWDAADQQDVKVVSQDVVLEIVVLVDLKDSSVNAVDQPVVVHFVVQQDYVIVEIAVHSNFGQIAVIHVDQMDAVNQGVVTVVEFKECLMVDVVTVLNVDWLVQTVVVAYSRVVIVVHQPLIDKLYFHVY